MGKGILKILWFAAFVLIFFAFIVYSAMLPLFGDQTEKAWQWLLPNLLPPFGIVFGIEVVARAAGDGGTRISATPRSSDAATWAMAMSLVYLAALLVSVAGVLFVPDPLAFLNMSNYWLAPLLALTTAVLGARFVAT